MKNRTEYLNSPWIFLIIPTIFIFLIVGILSILTFCIFVVVGLAEVFLLSHPTEFLFLNIQAESSSIPDGVDSNEAPEDTTNQYDAESEDTKQTTNDNTKEVVDGEEKDSASEREIKLKKRKKAEKILNDLPPRWSKHSTKLSRFPFDFEGFKLKNLMDLQRKPGEQYIRYLIRVHRTFSAACTMHSAGVLNDETWKLLIENTQMCTTERVLHYEMKYLELAEQEAIANGTLEEFNNSTDGKLLNDRRAPVLMDDRVNEVLKRDRINEAKSNYDCLKLILTKKAAQGPEYDFLRDIFEHTVLEKTNGNMLQLAKKDLDFYYYLRFSDQLWRSVLLESGVKEEGLARFKTHEQMREWLFFLENKKKDPHFLEFKR